MQNKKLLRIASAVLSITILAGSVYCKDMWQEAPVYAWASSELQSQKEENDAQIADMQKKLDDIGKDKAEASDYQNTLTDKIKLQEENITIVDEQLKRVSGEIEDTQKEISDTEAKIADMQVEIDEDLVEFKKRIRAMYVNGNDSLASALVGATDFFDFLSKYDLISRIAKHDNDLVNGLKDQLTERNEEKAHLEEKQDELNAQLEEHKKTRDELKSAITQLQSDFEESVEYSTILEEKQAMLNDNIADLESANLELEEEDQRILDAILEAERARKEQEEAAANTKPSKPNYSNPGNSNSQGNNNNSSSNNGNSSNSGSSNNNNTQQTQPPVQQTKPKQTTTKTKQTQPPQTNPPQTEPPQTDPPQTEPPQTTPPEPDPTPSSYFGWPCPGFYTLTSGFGPRWGTHHSGIDISSGGIAGAPVVASMSGTVISVVTGCPHDYSKSSSCGCGGGYGNYVIIQHSDGYSTLYAHMSSVAVSSGQTVSQGQTIGYVGSTGFSTGPHLHFEVRVNGNRVDPEQYLY